MEAEIKQEEEFQAKEVLAKKTGTEEGGERL